jgi:hypothetical protein
MAGIAGRGIALGRTQVGAPLRRLGQRLAASCGRQNAEFEQKRRPSASGRRLPRGARSGMAQRKAQGAVARASRLRGRIEAVLDAARARGHIARNEANPARWRGHLDKLLPKRAKLTRGPPVGTKLTSTARFGLSRPLARRRRVRTPSRFPGARSISSRKWPLSEAATVYFPASVPDYRFPTRRFGAC